MAVNIAVCDDEQEALEMMQEQLNKAADKISVTIDIDTYMDANILIDLISNDKANYDILFLDIDMPHISGLEVAKKLR